MPDKPTPAVPRPSASLIVVNARNEVLLVHRNTTSTSFAGAHVFPGGNYDRVQDDSLEMTAIRETFEETGLLLASSPSSSGPTDSQLDAARVSVYAQQTVFRDFLAQYQLTPDTALMLPFTQWVTPPTLPKRFQTQFYITFLASAPASGFSRGAKEERRPTPDGGHEVLAAQFVHPRAALAAFRAHSIGLMPPQFYLLTTLADLLGAGPTTSLERERVESLARGHFGHTVIRSRPLRRPEGGTAFLYQGDEAYGGPKGRVHRCLLTPGPSGVEMELLRNFDIFTEMDAPASTAYAKL